MEDSCSASAGLKRRWSPGTGYPAWARNDAAMRATVIAFARRANVAA
jgi:hypothetical protein